MTNTFMPSNLDPEAAKFVAIDTRTAYAIMAALDIAEHAATEPWKVAEIAAASATLRTSWVDAPYTVSATLRLR